MPTLSCKVNQSELDRFNAMAETAGVSKAALLKVLVLGHIGSEQGLPSDEIEGRPEGRPVDEPRRIIITREELYRRH